MFCSHLHFVRIKVFLVAYEFWKLHKKKELKIIKMSILEAAQNDIQLKSGRLKFEGLNT
jgi:hypothetical protein